MFMTIWTIATAIILLLVSTVSGFSPPSFSSTTPSSLFFTAKTAPDNNFAGIAETISDAARSLRGQTVVVKYGGVC